MISSTLLNALATLLAAHTATAQGFGKEQTETHPKLSWKRCTGTGGTDCTPVAGELTLDANYRWIHEKAGYSNCFEDNTWVSRVCTTNKDCTAKCVLDGADYKRTYGVTSANNSVTMNFKTYLDYASNVGSKVYLMQDGDHYEMFKLVGNEFSFEVDVSKLPSGVSGSLYFVAMPQKGFGTAGARYGTGYCDAQCDRSVKWINGEANVEGWTPSSTDQYNGVGAKGACCTEFDIWNANSISTAMTAHSCQPEGYSVCTGSDCGGAYSTSRYAGACDPEGCDFNPYRVGVKDFYGPGMKVNTSKPFTVTTQFIGEGSSLKGIKRFYVQDGKVFANPEPKTPGLSGNAMDQAWCDAQKVTFQDDVYSFGQHGGMAAVGKGMDAGMVLVMKIWDDYYTNMLWLDSTLPIDADPSKPGVVRGSCGVDSGVPLQVENQYATSSVTFSNIKFGPIGSTFKQPADT